MNDLTPTTAATSDKQAPIIHVVDDDDDVRTGLAMLIGTVGLRVRGWHHPVEFLAQYDRDAIGAIVLDVRMPGLNGLAVLEKLMQEKADQPVIMLTGHGTVAMCRRAFKTGAVEFLEKPVDDVHLLDALSTAVQQHVALRQRVGAQREAAWRLQSLTPRETGVLRLIIRGLTNKQIGRAINLSPRTVEAHRAHVFEKLETPSLAALIRGYAGLVSESSDPSTVLDPLRDAQRVTLIKRPLSVNK